MITPVTRTHTITIGATANDLVDVVVDGIPYAIRVEPVDGQWPCPSGELAPHASRCGHGQWRVTVIEDGWSWEGAEDERYPDAHSALWDAVGCIADTLDDAAREEGP